MATVYSGEVAVDSYNRIRIKCDYSGSSATLTIQFRRTSSYTTTWSASSATLDFNGQSKSASYSYSGTVGTNWVDLRSGISGYSISSSGGTYNWTMNKGNGILGGSGTITIPAQGSKPSNGYINDTSSTYSNGILYIDAGEVGVADGGLSLTTKSFYVSETEWVSGIASQVMDFTNNSSMHFSHGESEARHGGIEIQFNRPYYTALYAANSAGNYTFNGPLVVAAPAPVSFFVHDVSSEIAVIGYNSQGCPGVYPTEDLQYSLDGGVTWITTATVGTSFDSFGTFAITGLIPGAAQLIYFRTHTPAGNAYFGGISVATKDARVYGPVSGNARKTRKLYASLSGSSEKIIKLYGSEDGRAKLIYKENQ